MAEGDPLRDGKHRSFDTSKPNVARVYDVMLGGKDNFAADREFVAEILRFAPLAPQFARACTHVPAVVTLHKLDRRADRGLVKHRKGRQCGCVSSTGI